MQVRTVLLPFKRRIIYNQFMTVYSISFGSCLRRRFKEIYLTAKQNGRIITTLDPDLQAAQQRASQPKPTTELVPVAEEILALADRMTGRSGGSAVQRSAYALLRASAALAGSAAAAPNDLERLRDDADGVRKALNRAVKALQRAEGNRRS